MSIRPVTLDQVLRANGLGHRPIQDQAATEIAAALRNGGRALADVPTGGGKSILAAELSPFVGERGNLILAASTRAQVHQLVDVTGPMFVKAGIGGAVIPALGRGNYVCMDRARKAHVKVDESRGLLLRNHRGYLSQHELGLIQSDDELGCTNSGADKCFEDGYNQMLTRLRWGGNVAVFTHASLIIGTLKIKAGPLQVTGKDALFIDEGHNLADSIGDHLGAVVGVNRFTKLERDLAHHRVPMPGEPPSRLWSRILRKIGPAPTRVDDPRPMWVVMPEIEQVVQTLLEAKGSAASVLEGKDYAGMALRLDRLRKDVATFAEEEPARPTARWVSQDGSKAHAKVVVVDEEANALFESPGAVLVASATLLPEAPRLGVDVKDVIKVGSPFNLAANRVVYMPPALMNKAPTQNWFDRRDQLIRLVRAAKGRTLVLTPNSGQVPIAADVLRQAGLGPVAEQEGTESLPDMIERFRQGKIKVLVGTRSLWEGVDIPGPALTLVVLLSWPNPVLSDPAIRVQREGMPNSKWWAHYRRLAAVPAMQAIGRLIRTETDRGMFALLDARVSTQDKAEAIVGPSPVTTSIDQACAWLMALDYQEAVS